MRTTVKFAAASIVGLLIVSAPALLVSFGRAEPKFDPAVYGTIGQWLASLASIALLYFLLNEKAGREDAAEIEQDRAQRSAALLTCPNAITVAPNQHKAPEIYRDRVEQVAFRNDRHAPVYNIQVSTSEPAATSGQNPDGGALIVSYSDQEWPVLMPGDQLCLRLHKRSTYAEIHLASDDDDLTVMTQTENYFGFELSYTDELGNRWVRRGNNVLGWTEQLPSRRLA